MAAGLGFLLPIILKNGIGILKQLKSSGKARDIHAANIIERQKDQIERIVQAKAYLNNNQIPNLPDQFSLLFMMFLNEAQRTAEATMQAAAALADEDVDIQPIIEEARNEIAAHLTDPSKPDVV